MYRLISKQALTIYAFALAVFVTVFFLMSEKPGIEVPTPLAQHKLTDENYVEVQIDTFKMLVKRAYGSTTDLSNKHDKLVVTINNTGALKNDFINANKELVAENSGKFKVTINKGNSSLEASFGLVNKNGNKYVFVPADVLFSVTDKAYNR